MNKVAKVREVALCFLGVNPGRLPTDSALPDVPLINIKDIDSGGVLPRDQLATVKSPGPSQEQQLLRVGDVLVSIRGTLLKTAIVTEEAAGSLASANLAIFRPNPQVILPAVLRAVFQSEASQSRLLGQTTGAVIKGLQIGTLKEVTFILPPLAKQMELAALMQKAEEQYQIAMRVAAERRSLALSVVAQHLEAPA